MSLYRIANLYVNMSPKYDHLKSYAQKYLCDDSYVLEDGVDVIDINVSDEFLAERQKENPHLSLSDCEYMWTGSVFAHKMLDKNGFMLHSSAVVYNGNAYLFSADSGTGKSTHTSFWQQVFGKDEAVIINDDKPVIRNIDGVFFASGTPFSGKSDLNEDITAPVKAVCFIYRSEVNEIRKIEPSEALHLILEQTVRPKAADGALKLLDVLDMFLRKVQVYSLGVTYSPDSAVFAYNNLSRADNP